ncbi:MFS transporter [Thermogymnomonas acidicola]|uniref:MFS transporter n=1 Tax=Thermogymnomonas acidicola TaxID=399579 RepID=A0AA37BS43_9ARCH|nr:MFS transporter [Thermogymnomonas acidicola]GGM77125.1 MFS transporter [Thermogymnomonas acidicola]
MSEHRNLILASVMIGMLMSAIDTTIVILALPTITESLKAPFLDTIWVILIYLLVLAALTTQLGRLGDIFGRGRAFNIGFLLFIAGSAASGAAPDARFLIAARAFQGLGAVLIQGNSSAIVADYFEPSQRGRAFGITSMGWNIGGVLGIVLGGIITTFIGWRYIFYINVPVGLIGFALGLKYIRDNRRTETKIDYAGTVLLVLLLSLISYGAVEIAGNGVKASYIAMVLVGLVLLVPFVLIERRVRDPVISMSAFREKLLSLSLTAATLQAVGFLSVLFLIIMYLQGIRGMTPLDASLLLVPGYVVSSLLAPRMGRLSDRVGPRLIAGTGIALMAVGVLVYLQMGVSTSIYIVVLGSIVTGIGGAMFWPSNNSAVMAGAPRNLYGSISGLLRTLTNIGTLMSYVIAISIAALSVPRYVAFEVFLGVTKLVGGVSSKFMVGIHAALIASLVILVGAAIASFSGGNGRARQDYRPESAGKK